MRVLREKCLLFFAKEETGAAHKSPPVEHYNIHNRPIMSVCPGFQTSCGDKSVVEQSFREKFLLGVLKLSMQKSWPSVLESFNQCLSFGLLAKSL